MNEQLRELVRERLSAAADCPAKEDIIEEITADLTEKYNELVSGGAQPEEAMEQVQAGIGDLDEVAAYINEVARRSAENQKAGNNNPFAGLDETMKQMARDISPSMRQAMADIRSAAGHVAAAARDVVRDSRGPIRDIAGSVKDQVKNAARRIDESIPRSRAGEFRYDYTVPSEGVTGIDVATSGGDVTFGVSQDENIYVVELPSTELREDQMAQIQVTDGILRIRQGHKSSAGSILFNYGMLNSNFEIYLPQRAWNTLRVTTASGDIDLEKGMEMASLTIQTTSGDLECPQIRCGSAVLETVSGDVDISGGVEELRLETISGDCDLSGTVDALFFRSTSGDLTLRLENMPRELNGTSVSGDTKLSLPDNDGFSLRYKLVSADIRSDFDLKTSLSAKSGTAVYLSGGDRNYSLQSVSGDIRIYRR